MNWNHGTGRTQWASIAAYGHDRARRGWLALFIGLALTAAATANDWPYNEQADAAADIQATFSAAQKQQKKVLLIFGANWCPDCRALDKALHGKSGELLQGQFIIVNIDVGNFDKNLDIARRFGNPTTKGIPAAVVANSVEEIIYVTKNGELANARRMGDDGIYQFFADKIAARAN